MIYNEYFTESARYTVEKNLLEETPYYFLQSFCASMLARFSILEHPLWSLRNSILECDQ